MKKGGVVIKHRIAGHEFNSYLIKSFTPGQHIENSQKDSIIYHYTSPDAFLSILKSGTIRFTDIRYLNDKSEGVYFVKVLLDFLEKYKNKYPLFEEVVSSLLARTDLNRIKNLETTNIEYNEILGLPYKPERKFVFCSCADADSLNMWNYYVNNEAYQGYNIGFRVEELLQSFDTPNINQIDSFLVYYGRVLYKETEHFSEIQNLAENMEKRLASNESGGNSPVALSQRQAQLKLRNYIDSLGAFYKHPKFSSEEEFRIIIEIADARIPRKEEDSLHYSGKYNRKIFEDFCIKRGLVVPYLTVSIPDNAIYRVTAAPMIEFDIAKLSIREFLTAKGFKNIQIHKSKIPVRF